MGAHDFHRILETCFRLVNITSLKGGKPVFDGHGMAFAKSYITADITDEGIAKLAFKKSFKRKLELYINQGDRPIVVLDGKKLPAKADELVRRQIARDKADGDKGNFMLNLNNGQAVTVRWVTPICDELGIDVVVAMYEADAVMAHMVHSKMADYVVTEDSDLSAFYGVDCLFKLDNHGVGTLFLQSDIPKALGLKPHQVLNVDSFRKLCVLFGCDFFKRIRGLGPVAARFIIDVTKPITIPEIEAKIRKFGTYAVSDDFQKKFQKALDVFDYQTIFDVQARIAVHLRPIPQSRISEDFTFVGPILKADEANRIGLGNQDPYNGEIFRNFDPTTRGADSVWNPKYEKPDWKWPLSFELVSRKEEDRRAKDCHVCDKTFATWKELQIHVERHEPKTIPCDSCDLFFRGKYELLRHRFNQHSHQHVCQRCGANFSSVTALRHHLDIAHNSDHQHACADCTCRYETSQGLAMHRIEIHGSSVKHFCKECNLIFINKIKYNSHNATMHDPSRRFRCGQCNRKFGSSRALTLHRNSHHGGSSLKLKFCHHCGRGYSKDSSLRVHIKNNHSPSNPFPCDITLPSGDICSYRLLTVQGVSKHKVKEHALGVIHKCIICNGKQFGDSSELKQHNIRCHSPDSTYQCPKCPCRFITARSLSNHYAQHIGRNKVVVDANNKDSKTSNVDVKEEDIENKSMDQMTVPLFKDAPPSTVISLRSQPLPSQPRTRVVQSSAGPVTLPIDNSKVALLIDTTPSKRTADDCHRLFQSSEIDQKRPQLQTIQGSRKVASPPSPAKRFKAAPTSPSQLGVDENRINKKSVALAPKKQSKTVKNRRLSKKEKEAKLAENRKDLQHMLANWDKCFMKFGSWTYDGFQIDLKHMNQEPGQDMVHMGIDLLEYYPSVEWDILSVPAERHEKFYPCCEEPYPDIFFNITLRRRTLFYTVNLIIPTVGIAYLSILVFYLPADSGEKIALCISILLSQTMFFLLISETIPSTSLAIPLLAKYLLFTTFLVGLSVTVTTLVLNVHYRKPSTHRMAPWVRHVFIRIIPRFLLMRVPEHVLNCSAGPSARNSPTSSRDDGCNGFQGVSRLSGLSLQGFSGFLEQGALEGYPGPASTSYGFSGFEPDNSRKKYPFEIQKAIHNVQFIQTHMQRQDEFDSEDQDWGFVAMVIDRIFLIIFNAAFFIGTIWILFEAPALYDYSEAIDKVISTIARKQYQQETVDI